MPRVSSDSHIFAFFCKDPLFHGQDFIELVDPALIRRVSQVIRLRAGEQLEVFNDRYCLRGNIEEISQKRIMLKIITRHELKPLKPEIKVYCGLLKKDAFEATLYSCAQMGVSTIVPLISSKIHKVWMSDKDYNRFFNIMIAACEQSKQFVVPKVIKPLSFEQGVSLLRCDEKTYTIFFDSHGIPMCNYIDEMIGKKPSVIEIIVGPEGGFSADECTKLDARGCKRGALTASILRSQEALLVGLGSIRSMIR
jgi:16S rRNA (uracil1498-N3)-methyltransferase